MAAGFYLLKQAENRRVQRQAELNQQAEQVKLTVPEGKTAVDIAELLDEKGLVKKETFLAAQTAFSSEKFPWLAVRPKNTGLEGFLFPDTYFFNKSTSPDQVIIKMLDNFAAKFNSVKKLTNENQTFIIPTYESLTLAARGQGLSLYQVLTLASIVEKETGSKPNESATQKQQRLDTERKIVAGIFYNRLLAGKALESDATLNYITKNNNPSLNAAELQINSPYNTYKYAGLPPTPICNPSLSSIQAVLNPAKTDYFYFFHVQSTGEAIFSKTFAEHVRKKLRYQK